MTSIFKNNIFVTIKNPLKKIKGGYSLLCAFILLLTNVGYKCKHCKKFGLFGTYLEINCALCSYLRVFQTKTVKDIWLVEDNLQIQNVNKEFVYIKLLQSPLKSNYRNFL